MVEDTKLLVRHYEFSDKHIHWVCQHSACVSLFLVQQFSMLEKLPINTMVFFITVLSFFLMFDQFFFLKVSAQK